MIYMNVILFRILIPLKMIETLRQMAATVKIAITYDALNLYQCINMNKYFESGFGIFKPLRQVWDDFKTGKLL